jgi:hypothetical protein
VPVGEAEGERLYYGGTRAGDKHQTVVRSRICAAARYQRGDRQQNHYRKHPGASPRHSSLYLHVFLFAQRRIWPAGSGSPKMAEISILLFIRKAQEEQTPPPQIGA